MLVFLFFTKFLLIEFGSLKPFCYLCDGFKSMFMKKVIYHSVEEKKAAFMKAVKLRQLWEKAVKENWNKETQEQHGLYSINVVP